jgi:hypothetical protein
MLHHMLHHAARRYEESSTFFLNYMHTRLTMMAAEAAIISQNGTCSAYATSRRSRKSVTATIYFQMAVDGYKVLSPSNALTGGLLGTSNVFRYLDKFHKARQQAAPSCASAPQVPCWLPAPVGLPRTSCCGAGWPNARQQLPSN